MPENTNLQKILSVNNEKTMDKFLNFLFDYRNSIDIYFYFGAGFVDHILKNSGGHLWKDFCKKEYKNLDICNFYDFITLEIGYDESVKDINNECFSSEKTRRELFDWVKLMINFTNIPNDMINLDKSTRDSSTNRHIFLTTNHCSAVNNYFKIQNNYTLDDLKKTSLKRETYYLLSLHSKSKHEKIFLLDDYTDFLMDEGNHWSDLKRYFQEEASNGKTKIIITFGSSLSEIHVLALFNTLKREENKAVFYLNFRKQPFLKDSKKSGFEWQKIEADVEKFIKNKHEKSIHEIFYSDFKYIYSVLSCFSEKVKAKINELPPLQQETLHGSKWYGDVVNEKIELFRKELNKFLYNDKNNYLNKNMQDDLFIFQVWRNFIFNESVFQWFIMNSENPAMKRYSIETFVRLFLCNKNELMPFANILWRWILASKKRLQEFKSLCNSSSVFFEQNALYFLSNIDLFKNKDALKTLLELIIRFTKNHISHWPFILSISNLKGILKLSNIPSIETASISKILQDVLKTDSVVYFFEEYFQLTKELNKLFNTNMSTIDVLINSKICETIEEIIERSDYSISFAEISIYFLSKIEKLKELFHKVTSNETEKLKKYYFIIKKQEVLKNELREEYTNLEKLFSKLEIPISRFSILPMNKHKDNIFAENQRNKIEKLIANGEYDELKCFFLNDDGYLRVQQILYINEAIMKYEKKPILERLSGLLSILNEYDKHSVWNRWIMCSFINNYLSIFNDVLKKSSPYCNDEIEKLVKIDRLINVFLNGYAYSYSGNDNVIKKQKLEVIVDWVILLWKNKCYRLIQFIFVEYQLNSKFDVFSALLQRGEHKISFISILECVCKKNDIKSRNFIETVFGEYINKLKYGDLSLLDIYNDLSTKSIEDLQDSEYVFLKITMNPFFYTRFTAEKNCDIKPSNIENFIIFLSKIPLNEIEMLFAYYKNYLRYILNNYEMSSFTKLIISEENAKLIKKANHTLWYSEFYLSLKYVVDTQEMNTSLREGINSLMRDNVSLLFNVNINYAEFDAYKGFLQSIASTKPADVHISQDFLEVLNDNLSPDIYFSYSQKKPSVYNIKSIIFILFLSEIIQIDCLKNLLKSKFQKIIKVLEMGLDLKNSTIKSIEKSWKSLN